MLVQVFDEDYEFGLRSYQMYATRTLTVSLEKVSQAGCSRFLRGRSVGSSSRDRAISKGAN